MNSLVLSRIGSNINVRICILFQTWPSDALEMVANKFLEDVELEDAVRAGVVSMCKMFHESVFTLSDR